MGVDACVVVTLLVELLYKGLSVGQGHLTGKHDDIVGLRLGSGNLRLVRSNWLGLLGGGLRVEGGGDGGDAHLRYL